jgi:O-antigen/teichoic acid export membrane protein
VTLHGKWARTAKELSVTVSHGSLKLGLWTGSMQMFCEAAITNSLGRKRSDLSVKANLARYVQDLRADVFVRWNRSSSFRRHVSILAGGTAVAQTINMGATPLLTRIYDARAFGNLQVYGSLLNIAMVVIALRYELAIVIPPDEKEAVNVLSVAIVAVAAVTGLLGIVVWILVHFGLSAPGTRDLIPYFWLLPIGAFGIGVYQVLVYWGLRHRAYKTIAVSKLTQVASQAVVQLSAGLLTKGALLGLLIGDVCGRIGGSWRIAKLTLQDSRSCSREIGVRSMWKAACRYRNYPLIMAGAGLINAAALQAVPLLLSAHYGPMLVGFYALVDRSMQAPIVLVAQSTSQVYIVQAAELGSSNPARLNGLFLKLVRSSLIYGVIPLILICAFGPPIFTVVFGSSWHAAGQLARILAPAYYFCFAHQCVCMTLPALERQSWQFGWDTFRLISIISVLVVATHFRMEFSAALLAFSVVSCITYASHLVICWLAIKNQVARVSAHKLSQPKLPLNHSNLDAV